MTRTTLLRNIPNELLCACVRRYRPYRNINVSPIPTGKFNRSFFVDADHEHLVLRIAPPPDTVFLFYERDMMKQEPGLHEIIRNKTNAPVPNILFIDETREIIPSDYLIMERLKGTPMTDALFRDRDRLHRQVGVFLAQVHRITSAKHGYVGPHHPMSPQSTWHEAFLIMWQKLLEDVAKTGHYSPKDVNYMSNLLDKRIDLFRRDGPARLLHMDIWEQNILTDGNDVTGILDWDRALWGDPEIEFAVLDYCGISSPAFWEGYGVPRDTSPEATIRNLFYLLYEIQKYIVIRHGRNKDPARARSYKDQTMRLAEKLLSFEC